MSVDREMPKYRISGQMFEFEFHALCIAKVSEYGGHGGIQIHFHGEGYGPVTRPKSWAWFNAVAANGYLVVLRGKELYWSQDFFQLLMGSNVGGNDDDGDYRPLKDPCNFFLYLDDEYFLSDEAVNRCVKVAVSPSALDRELVEKENPVGTAARILAKLREA